MLAAERHAEIAAALRRDGAVKVTELADALGVSEMTIRRDLDLLDTRDVLRKVHGGAVPHGGRGIEPWSTAKARRQHDEKIEIARAALAFVEDDMTVALSAGTTTLELARGLRTRTSLTVITNSMSIFTELTAPASDDTPGGRQEQAGPTVYLTGGTRTRSDALVGPIANAALASVRADAVFLGVHGIDPDAGLTTPNIAEAETDRKLIATGRAVFVLADHTKYREVGTNVIAPLSSVRTLITDSGLDAHARRELGSHIDDIVIAESGTSAP